MVACEEEFCLDCDFGGWVVVDAPTYDLDGLEERVCKDCDNVEDRAIPSKSIFFGKWTGANATSAGSVHTVEITENTIILTSSTATAGSSWTFTITSDWVKANNTTGTGAYAPGNFLKGYNLTGTSVGTGSFATWAALSVNFYLATDSDGKMAIQYSFATNSGLGATTGTLTKVVE